jgi:hypothetical protein
MTCGTQAKISSWGPGDVARWGGRLGTRVLPWLEPRRLLWGPAYWACWHGRHVSPSKGDAEGLCCQHRPTVYSWQVREQGLLTGVVPSRQTVEAGVALNHLSGWGVGPPERESILWSGSILCQSYHDPYACSSCNGTTLSGDDGMDSSSRVPVVRRAWELVVTSFLVWH